MPDSKVKKICNDARKFYMTAAHIWRENSHLGMIYRRIAGVCFELHSRVTLVQFQSAAASSLHRRLALLATSTRPSFSKNAYLGILFAPMYQKYSLVSFSFIPIFKSHKPPDQFNSGWCSGAFVFYPQLDRSWSRIAELNRSSQSQVAVNETV